MKKTVREIVGRIWLLFLAILAIFIFKIRNRTKVIGRENLPKERGIFFVVHHQTLIDSLLIGLSVCSVWDVFLYYRRIPWNTPDFDNFFKNPISRLIMYFSKCVPAHRHTANKELISQDIARFCQILQEKNESIVVFFEGTRTRDGQIGDCKYGVGRTIALAKPKYVIPVYLRNIQPIMPIASGFNFFKIYGGNKGEVVIGKPIQFSNLDDEEAIRNEVKAAVMNLQSSSQGKN